MNEPRIEALISSRALRRIVTRVGVRSGCCAFTTLKQENESVPV